MFVIYDDNHEIIATVIGPDETYGDILTKEGRKWIFHTGDAVSPITDCIDPTALIVVKKQEFAVAADKTQIGANGQDTATISGVQNGAAVSITRDGYSVASEIVTDGEVEFSTTTAGTYVFLFTASRYFPKTIEIVAQ